MIMKCANCYDSVATMLADKLNVIETMSDEIQTLRAKVEVLVEYVKRISACYRIEDVQMYAREALATYDKISEVNHG